MVGLHAELPGVEGPWHFVAFCTVAGVADPLYVVCANGQLIVARAVSPRGSDWVTAAKAYGKKAREEANSRFAVGLLTLTLLTHISFPHNGTRPTDAATEAAGCLAVLGPGAMTAQPVVQLWPRREGAPGLAAPGAAVTSAPVGRFASAGLRVPEVGLPTAVDRTVGDMIAHAPAATAKVFALTTEARDAVLQVGRPQVTPGAVRLPEGREAPPTSARVVPAPTDRSPVLPFVSGVDFAQTARRDAVLDWVKGKHTARCTSVADTPIAVATRMMYVQARCVL